MNKYKFVYGFTISLGAFLLFLIQPLIAKFLLPSFGGSSSVWSVSLMFFMTALLLGYAYAHVLSRFSLKWQIFVHTALLISGIVAALSHLSFWADNTINFNESIPEVGLLKILALSIGLPYFILASTGPLMQYWYAHQKGARNPYVFYALSNLASFAAIITFPFLFEPFFGMEVLGKLWTFAFILCAAMLFLCLYFFSRWEFLSDDLEVQRVTLPRATIWIGLAFLPAMLLLATTNEVTQAIAPVPFLWLVSLGLYLLSFSLAFALDFEERFLRGMSAFLIAAIALLVCAKTLGASVIVFFPVSMLVLFLGSLVCHGYLYISRPKYHSLTVFYLFVSLGGALGGVFASLLAPMVFKDFLELPLGLFLFFCLAFFLIFRDDKNGSFLKAISVSGLLVACLWVVFGRLGSNGILYQARNFYGVLKISRTNYGHGLYLKSLYNGTILHGSQFTGSGFSSKEPTTYYSRASGVGQALTRREKPMRVGVIGLGTGTVASYCRGQDFFKFYEINPAVIRIAKNEFEYLRNCPGKVEISQGDGRISLLTEKTNKQIQDFDVLILDAFTDDSIPVHLLTTEAFDLYLDHLDDKGILAVHISNRYIDLSPVITQNAVQYGLFYITIQSNSLEHDGKKSVWMILSADRDEIRYLAQLNPPLKDNELKKVRPWSDNYSNILPLLQF